ncbi:MAG: type III pantothenate kinase [Fimbriiglobus sp.]|nr:type III pantothenate kinase [Fimbriiglobus sp.]
MRPTWSRWCRSLNAWDDQFEKWGEGRATRWAVGGVNPKRIDEFLHWQRRRSGSCVHFTSYSQLPLTLNVDTPETVGVDRLFGCVAANARRRPGCAAVTIDVGTAVTVNVLDPQGVFRGGCIFPGFGTMTQALFLNTAKLPQVVATADPTPFPGTNTADAIRAGIRCAVVGGVLKACDEVAKLFGPPEGIDAFVTGGGSTPDLFHAPGWTFQHAPTLNLEGIRLTALSRPA